MGGNVDHMAHTGLSAAPPGQIGHQLAKSYEFATPPPQLAKRNEFMTKTYTLTLDERGRPVGEGHPLAKLTDREVDLMRTMHEQGCGLMELARGFEVSKRTVWKIVTYRSRVSTVARWVEKERPVSMS